MPVANRQLLKDFGKQYNRLALHGSSQGVCCREMGFCSDQKSYVRDVTVAIPAHEGRDAWSMSRSAMWALEGHLALVFKGHWLTVNSFSLPYRSLSSHSRNLLWFTGNVLPDISSPKIREHLLCFISDYGYISNGRICQPLLRGRNNPELFISWNQEKLYIFSQKWYTIAEGTEYCMYLFFRLDCTL